MKESGPPLFTHQAAVCCCSSSVCTASIQCRWGAFINWCGDSLLRQETKAKAIKCRSAALLREAREQQQMGSLCSDSRGLDETDKQQVSLFAALFEIKPRLMFKSCQHVCFNPC